jgi:hypothetical protein
MATFIAAEACKMLGTRREVGNAGIDYAACALGQPSKTGATPLTRSFENKPQSLLDQIPELAAAQRRLRLGLALEFVGNFDSHFH